jgi:uncharacterized protein
MVLDPRKTIIPAPRVLFVLLTMTFMLVIGLQLLWGEGNPRWKTLALEICVFVPSLIYLRVRRGSPARTFMWSRVGFPWLMSALFLGLGLSLLADELDRFVQRIVPMNQEILMGIQEAMIARTLLDWVLIVLGVIVVASVVEESLFRGLVLQTMEKTHTRRKAVLASAFLFSLLHFNPWWLLNIFILGLVLGWLTVRSRSIWPAVMLHAVRNGLSVCFINTDPRNMGWLFGDSGLKGFWFAVAAVLTTAGFWILIKTPGKTVSERGVLQ